MPERSLEIEHVYNTDPASGREAYIRTLALLIEFILANERPELLDVEDVA
jgi:hypothetical protein